MFAGGSICLSTGPIHTVKPLNVNIPKGRLTVVTGVSGSGKTTLVLESLVPALEAATGGKKLPKHIVSVEADGIEQVKLIDATPIGINVRSTVATYANVHDELRKIFAKTDDAKRFGYKPAIFPITPENCVVRFVMVPAPSISTYSFFPTSKFRVPNAEVPDMPDKPAT